MGKLTKEQKAQIERRLLSPWGRVDFVIDGHDVVAKVEPYKTRRFVIVVYVDGAWKGQYLQVGCDMQKRFYRLIKVSLFKPKEKAELIQKFGKRKANEYFELNRASYYSVPDWTNAKAMLRHFEANNESVQLVEKIGEVQHAADT